VLTEARSSRERGAGEVDGVKRRRVGAGFGEGSMRRSSGLQFPRAGALVGCGPREAVSEVKRPAAGLNRGENSTHRRWVSGEKSGRAGVEVVDGGRGDTTGTKAELLRRIRWRRGPGRAARRRVATAVPCSALTERGERRLGLAAADGGAGRPQGQLKGPAGILGMRTVKGAARDLRRDARR
jgi:hypothetical protein